MAPTALPPVSGGSQGSTAPRSLRSMLINPLAASVAKSQAHAVTSDFPSDIGRKKFGFSHEELEGTAAYYEGQFLLYQRYGEGTLHNPQTGAKYVGQFQRDQFHGKGDQTWPDGSRYVGQWRNGQKHGHGEYTSPDQLPYVGQWEGGLRHGQGVQAYANDDRYEGWWFRGMCSGVGTYFFADGSRYEGGWANGRYDGAGILYGPDGSRERHWYNNGLLIKVEVLPPSKAQTVGSRRPVLGGKVLSTVAREDVHKPAVLPKPAPSRFLIHRETAGLDLSAPPLRAKTAPARGPAELQGL